MANEQAALASALKAIANDRRLQILEWLKDPRSHFRPQVDGDLVEDGVCGVLIAEKLGVTQPTLSEHMKVLSQAGLVRPKWIKQWTFYKRDEARIAALKRAIAESVGRRAPPPRSPFSLPPSRRRRSGCRARSRARGAPARWPRSATPCRRTARRARPGRRCCRHATCRGGAAAGPT